ncbi:MAG: VWA domain-containing protein [Anaerolineae bacterium]
MTVFGLRLAFASPGWLVLLLAVPVAYSWERRLGRPRAALARAGMVAALAVAAGQPTLSEGAVGAAVILADASASVDTRAVARATRALSPAGEAAVLGFGDAEATDLEAAIDAGVAALAGGGRLILVSDGRPTAGDAVAAARRARAAGVRVDVLPVAVAPGPDAMVSRLAAPAVWRRGAAAPVVVHLRADTEVGGRLRVWRGERLVADRPAQADPTGTAATVAVPLGPREPEVVGLRATFEVPGDTRPANNVAYAALRLAPPPRVLVVGDAVGAVALADALAPHMGATTVTAPELVPADTEALAAWDVVALVDVAADRLGPRRAEALASYVGAGGGLLLTAGRQSFTRGGWRGTPLAALAPVAMDPAPGGVGDPVTLVLILDVSASMGGGIPGSPATKLDMAREAASLAADSLAPGDVIGVVAYSDTPEWVVPMSRVGPGRGVAQVQDALGRLAAGGGTRILPGLDLGLEALAEAEPASRHGVLLTDGQDAAPDPAAFEAAVARARRSGVTLSTLGLGDDADAELLGRLARIGRGRFHAVRDPGDLPRLTVAESRIMRDRAERKGSFRPVVAADHPAVAGVDMAGVPPLTGYLALAERPGADVVLATPAGDPLLAFASVGLGHVAAWTSDTGEDWAAEWIGADAAAALWGRVVRQLAPPPATDGLGVGVTVSGGTATIVVNARDETGRPIDLAPGFVVVTHTLAGQAIDQRLALNQVGPGRYTALVPAEVGVTAARVELTTSSGPVLSAFGWAWDGPPELRSHGGGPGHLAAVAEAGGGAVLTRPPSRLHRAKGPTPLAPLLAAAAALVWVAEVAQQLGVGGPGRLRRRGPRQPRPPRRPHPPRRAATSGPGGPG